MQVHGGSIESPSVDEDETFEHWFDTTPSALRRTTLEPSGFPIGVLFAYTEAIRSGTRLVLALQGWRLEHGQLPESLELLVPAWFDELPLDLATRKAFAYYPQGQSVSSPIGYNGGVNLQIDTRPAHTPYLEATDPFNPNQSIKFPIESGIAARTAEPLDE